MQSKEYHGTWQQENIIRAFKILEKLQSMTKRMEGRSSKGMLSQWSMAQRR